MHTHAASAFSNRMTLTFELLTLESMQAELSPRGMRVQSLALIAQTVYL